MDRKRFVALGFATAAMAVMFALPPAALGGPPLICHPLDIGGAKSLPWSSHTWNLSGKEDYDVGRLVADTLALLTPSTSVIVRMETLRRATLYAQKDPRVAKELVLKLRARAQEGEAKVHPDALTLFDFGYLIECYKQANWTFVKKGNQEWETVEQPSAAMGLDGYAWVEKAISLRGQDPEMEFAAAIITVSPHQKSHDEHLRKAVAGAADGSLLAKNLVLHFGDQGSTIAQLRAKFGGARN